MPSSIRTIPPNTFEGCTELTNIEIPPYVTTIEGAAFNGCTGLTSIKMPSSVTKILFEAFMGCSGLTSVVIPSSVTEIAQDAFMDCSGLTELVFLGSVKDIDYSAFDGCDNLAYIRVPKNTTNYYKKHLPNELHSFIVENASENKETQSKNKASYRFNGEVYTKKNRFCQAVVRYYADQHPEARLEDLQKVFYVSKKFPMVASREQALAIFNSAGTAGGDYFLREGDDIDVRGGKAFVWNYFPKTYFDPFMKIVNELGYEFEVVGEAEDKNEQQENDNLSDNSDNVELKEVEVTIKGQGITVGFYTVDDEDMMEPIVEFSYLFDEDGDLTVCVNDNGEKSEYEYDSLNIRHIWSEADEGAGAVAYGHGYKVCGTEDSVIVEKCDGALKIGKDETYLNDITVSKLIELGKEAGTEAIASELPKNILDDKDSLKKVNENLFNIDKILIKDDQRWIREILIREGIIDKDDEEAEVRVWVNGWGHLETMGCISIPANEEFDIKKLELLMTDFDEKYIPFPEDYMCAHDYIIPQMIYDGVVFGTIGGDCYYPEDAEADVYNMVVDDECASFETC